MSGGPVALDAEDNVFEVGDYAEHVNGELDAREVVKILEDNMIEIFILTSGVMVPAENYLRIPKKVSL